MFRPPKFSQGHIVVVDEEVVLGAHAAEEFGHVVGKQKGCLTWPMASTYSNTLKVVRYISLQLSERPLVSPFKKTLWSTNITKFPLVSWMFQVSLLKACLGRHPAGHVLVQRQTHMGHLVVLVNLSRPQLSSCPQGPIRSNEVRTWWFRCCRPSLRPSRPQRCQLSCHRCAPKKRGGLRVES